MLTYFTDGSYAGTCQYFPDLDGDGRADLHSIMGTWTNKAETWFNRCGLIDLSGDDNGWDQVCYLHIRIFLFPIRLYV